MLAAASEIYSYTAFRVDYLHVDDVGEISRFLQVVESLHLHQLPHYLIGNLVSPLINYRHVYVINKHSHLFASWRSVGVSHSLVHITLNRSLQIPFCNAANKIVLQLFQESRIQ